jgi:hypothetical protein
LHDFPAAAVRCSQTPTGGLDVARRVVEEAVLLVHARVGHLPRGIIIIVTVVIIINLKVRIVVIVIVIIIIIVVVVQKAAGGLDVARRVIEETVLLSTPVSATWNGGGGE